MSLEAAAASVLRANDRVTHTVPAPQLYPHQWAWDSAFAAIGWVHLDPSRAVTELRTLLAGVWDDGRVPHIRYHSTGNYLPGPEMWGADGSSTITQPPVWAIAARRIAEVAGDPSLVADLIPAMEASHEFFAAQRDPLGWGAVAIAHPWESGMDNAPQWDSALADIDPEPAPDFERVDVDQVDDPGQRPSDDQYRRYLSIVVQIAADGHGPGPFAVYDPFMTSVLARAETDLSVVAAAADAPEVAGRATGRADRLCAALLDRLWDEEAGRFVHRDARSGLVAKPDVIGAHVPLMLGDALPAAVSDRLRAGLTERFGCPWPLPTTSPSDPAFDGQRYWRGPTWMNINWLLGDRPGLAVIERSLELLARNGFREYFDPVTGSGLGARDFTWSAAVALDWMADL